MREFRISDGQFPFNRSLKGLGIAAVIFLPGVIFSPLLALGYQTDTRFISLRTPVRKDLLTLSPAFTKASGKLASNLAQEDTILNRYTRYLYHAAPHTEDRAAMTLSADSTVRWADIDYQDTHRANWQPLRHLERVRALAMTWANPASRRYHDPDLWTTLNLTLDHWLKKRYRNSNWWYNEIGVPQLMRDILVLLRDTLTPQRLAGGLQVLGQCRVQQNGQGANLVWSADLGLHLGALTGNDTLIRKCALLLTGEVHITDSEGLQPDYSFHQHGARLQEYQYGAAYLQGNVRLAWELQGTPWAYPEEKVKLLAGFVLDSWQWMARGIHTVPGTVDRSVSRPDALNSADLRESLPYLSALYPAAASEFHDIDRRQNDQAPPLPGFRYFPCSDFTAYEQPQFSFFLKTISNRTLATESINGENRKGRLLNSGDSYIVQTGEEYTNLMPVWDWDKLPGVTTFDGATRIDRRAFTGSVAGGGSGLTVMDYALTSATGSDEGATAGHLTARKFWGCHNGFVVCLLGGISDSGLKGKAYTTLDQCRWQGQVTVGRAGSEQVLQEGDHVLGETEWFRHGDVSIIFLQPTQLDIHAGTATGSWAAINSSGSAAPITEKVFLPILIHESNVPIAYVLTAGTTLEKTKKLAGHPPCEVICNDAQLQAIRFTDGMVMAAFYSRGSLLLEKGSSISVDHPCLLLLSGKEVYIADPSRQSPVITLRMGQTSHTIQLPADGTTVTLGPVRPNGGIKVKVP